MPDSPSHFSRGFLAFLLATWVLVGMAGVWEAYQAAKRPANTMAKSVKLVPKAGGYGPVHVSVMTLPASAQTDAAHAVVMVGLGTGEDFLVTLPDGRLFEGSSAAESRPADDHVPFTVQEMTRRLPAGAKSQGAVELWHMVTRAVDRGGGLPTRLASFTVVDADPWVPAWRGSAGRLRVTLAACVVVVWAAVAFELGRRLAARPVAAADSLDRV